MRFSLTDVFPLPFWVQQQTDGWIPTRFSPRQTRLSSLVQPTVFRSPQHLVSFAVCSMLEAERRIPYFRYRRHARSVICASCQQGVSVREKPPKHLGERRQPARAWRKGRDRACRSFERLSRRVGNDRLQNRNGKRGPKLCERESLAVGGYATCKLRDMQPANKENSHLL